MRARDETKETRESKRKFQRWIKIRERLQEREGERERKREN